MTAKSLITHTHLKPNDLLEEPIGIRTDTILSKIPVKLEFCEKDAGIRFSPVQGSGQQAFWRDGTDRRIHDAETAEQWIFRLMNGM